MALWASPLFAQDARPASRHVRAAILLDDHPEPILGEADCQANMPCQVLYHFDLGFEVTISLSRQGATDDGEIRIRCADDCSFKPGWSSVRFGSERHFELYYGEDDHGSLLLISRPRMGELSLIIE
ncbi:UNVERIFIED_ORG: hypothetical protein LHK14_18135 [Roseateles sp. XES5]|nr:hypothetical protein [Roseateles sp. XES5]